MKILLFTDHCYPAADPNGTGRHPREFPSGSGYHLHDLLAKGLAEEGHEVFYQLGRGAARPLPDGVHITTKHVQEADVCHALAGPARFADPMLERAATHGQATLLTCHMYRAELPGQPNWTFVSQSLAQAHGLGRVVLNGLDPNDFIWSEAKQDYFLFLGSMDKAIDKGLDLALELSRRKGFRLIVGGSARSYEAIQRTAELCERSGAEYLGDVRGTRKAELLAGARAVLFPSRLREGCPLVTLEAMFSGTPVISSANGGSPEIVFSDTGILCQDETEWDAAVDRIGHISPARCRAVAMERFHYKRMVKDYLAEYELELCRTSR